MAARDDETSDSETLLAAAAGAAGMIGVATLGVEWMTDRWMARVVGVAPFFMSTPLGVGTVALGTLIARESAGRALPALVLGSLYWGVFVLCW